MTISLITANPDTSNPADFAVQADLAWQQLIDVIPEINTVIEAFNFNATNSTSTTSLLISVASKALTVQTSKSYVVGMAVTIAYTTDPTQWMRGEVTAYNSGTGSLTVNVRYISATTGTYTAWTISQASIESSVADSLLKINTGNGHGSTNTRVRLYTTTATNTGTAFTVSHSATLGTRITINEPGIYTFSANDFSNSGTGEGGFVINGASPTTSISGVNDTIDGYSGAAVNIELKGNVTTRCNTNDVIWWQTNGNLNATGSRDSTLTARKIGNV